MSFDRRTLVTAAGFGMAAGLAARPVSAAPTASRLNLDSATPADLGLSLKPGDVVTSVLQSAVDQAASRRVGLRLPPGTFLVDKPVVLRPGLSLSGALGATRLVFLNGAGLTGNGAHGLRLLDVALDGSGLPLDAGRGIEGLLTLSGCSDVLVSGIAAEGSGGNGMALAGVSGSIVGCRIADARRAALFSIDGKGLEIARNVVRACSDNGILVWTSKPTECGTTVQSNRIERIAARSGGSGQYGNGINIYRAAGVLVAGNRITDCAYTAIRGNAASNIQMIGNSCSRLGEVALYAEFGFEGALIANNLVDTAAAGISVTNFDVGGRLAVVQGNLIRNLSRREHEPQDKRGEGISVEADSIVSGNVVENAPTAGIFIGWSRYVRDVSATGNLIRGSGIGIAVQAEPASGLIHLATGGGGSISSGKVLIANNMVSGALKGAVRTLRLHEPFGPDLAGTTSTTGGITCTGNVAA